MDQARVVIIGAGIAGCSVAYHLTELGWRDVVVVDQGPLFETGGSTSHAPGMVFQVNFAKVMSEFAKYTGELYSSLQLDGQSCYHRVGGLEVAWTKERFEDLKRKTAAGKLWGLDTDLLSASEARKLVPLLSENIHGAMYSAGDGVTKQVSAAEAMANAAMERGATFHGNSRVTDVEVADGAVQAVVTEQGRILTELVVSAAGIWGPVIGRMAGAPVPLQPMRHQFAHTGPLPELSGVSDEARDPILRHQDASMYLRQRQDHYVIGAYRHEPLLVEAENIPDWDESPEMPSMMEWQDDIFEFGRRAAADVVPCLDGVDLTRKVNGMFSFTPDGMPLLGESPQVRGFWLAEAVWITHAGGVGKAVAEWMVDGAPSSDLRECDIARFHPYATTPSYVRARGAQQYREVYDIIHPQQQMEHPRNLRTTPYHKRFVELGAELFENTAWERPQWFAANEALLEGGPAGPDPSGWEARYWSPIVGAEHRATRHTVALFDLTPFTKLEVSGEGALAYLQSITGNNMDKPDGLITYTSMLDERGGIKCDLTITRLAADRFLVVTGGSTGIMDLQWMRRHRPDDGTVHITDVSGAWCCIGVWGPKARDLVSSTSPDDFSNDAFPYMTARRVMIGDVPALAQRISYVGELGWEVYAPTEFGLGLWDTLWEAGQPLGLIAAGGGSFDTLRLEKGYRLWGNDIHTEYNPYEAGLGFTVRLKKGVFVGRDAVTEAKDRGVGRKLSCLTLDDKTVAPVGKEPVYVDGNIAGYVTSAGYGYTVGESIAYSYLPVEHADVGTAVEIEYFGTRHRARVAQEPLFDPENARLKS